ncbi:MAG TPA: hypothetical protein VIM16_00185 [Mucilaginibacter sp.]|jgi:hypothetical protein
MTDRELLELAAKANMTDHVMKFIDNHYGTGMLVTHNSSVWNPLTDDGDALRLAVKLHIDLCINNGCAEAVWIDEVKSETHSIEVPCDEDFEGWEAKVEATRRAIVRAAAEIVGSK